MGFGIIAFVIFVGWLLARLRIINQESRLVLNRVAFFAASPALLFMIISRSDLRVVFSGVLLASALAVVVVGLIYFVVARLWMTKDAGRLAIGTNTAIYTNINNIGLPVAIYVIGDAQYVGPIMLMQLIIMAPVLLSVLDSQGSGRLSAKRIITQPVRNPIVIASLLGVVVAATGIELPEYVVQPLDTLGGAAVPLMLLAFGASLNGTKPLAPGTGRREVLFAASLKTLLMPVVAYVMARFVMQLPDEQVYAVTVLGALPTAQNMYQYALQYRTGETIARDVIFLTTFASLPVMLVIAAVLHP